MNKKIQGYIIARNVYQDSNLIVSILSKTGIVSFLAKGALKVPSKLARLCELYSFCDLELVSSKDDQRNTLIGGKVIRRLDGLESKLGQFCLLSMIAETVIINNKLANECYHLFEKVFDDINDNLHIPNYLFYILKLHMINNGLINNSCCCSICGCDSHLIGLSLKNGGLICFNCSKKIDSIQRTEQFIDSYAKLLKSNLHELNTFVLDKTFYKEILIEMFQLLDETSGVHFKSQKLINTFIIM